MKKRTLLIVLMLIVALHTFGQDQPYQAVVGKVFKALQSKDISALRSCPAESCTMAGLDTKTTQEILPQVVQHFSAFSAFEMEHVIPKGNTTRVNVLLHYLEGATGRPCIVLNRNCQILQLNIIRDPKLQCPAGNQLPTQAPLPFKQINGCLYVTGTINGKSGLFMIDNGTFGPIDNRRFAGDQVQDTVNYASVLNISGANGKGGEA